MPRYGERELPRKSFICRHCKVPVISKTNTKPLLGREHGKRCPRRNK